MRVRTIILLLGWALLAFGLAPSASAQDEHDDEGEPAPVTTTPPGEVAIGDGFSFASAEITTPGEAAPRTLDATQTAVFVQSWIATAYFGGAASLQDPPAGLPVSRIDVTGTWGSAAFAGTMVVYFATDGTTGWVSWPQVDPVPAPIATPAPPNDWFLAPPKVLEAFTGEGELEDSLGVFQSTSSTTAPPAEDAASPESSSGSSSDSPPIGLWAGLGAALVLLAGGGFWLRRRRAAA